MNRDNWHSKKFKSRSEMQKASWNEKRKRKQGKAHSKKLKELWADPDYRKRMMKVRKNQVTAKSCANISKSKKKMWSDPTFYKQMCKIRKKQATPERNAANGVRVAKLWEDTKYYAKQMKSRHKTMYSNPDWLGKVVTGLAKARKIACKKNGGRNSWNDGHTKDTHSSLMMLSETNRGIIPDWNKYKSWYPSAKDKQIEMRCSYEPAFALWMDYCHIEWEYQSHHFYVGHGPWLGVTYTPDFYLPVQRTFVELKGYYSPENELK